MNKVVLLRHAESVFSRDNCFTGWSDPDLTEIGISQARAAGRALRREGFSFDLGYASYLRRAVKTLWLVLEEMDLHWIEVVKSWQLNERHYGTLEGLTKTEAIKVFGEEQVRSWRRKRDSQPPLLAPGDPRCPAVDGRYSHVPADSLPAGESLEQLAKRSAGYWRKAIFPAVTSGRKVIVASHNNTLRALMEEIEGQTASEADIAPASPVIYELDREGRVSSRSFLTV